MFTLALPAWFTNYVANSKPGVYPGIFLYMTNPVPWAGYDTLLDLIRVCTPNKNLKQQITETVESYKKEIQEHSKEQVVIKASLTFAELLPGQLFLRICESVLKPKITYVLVLEFTPQGNLERIVRAFTLTDSSYPNKKG